MVCVFSSSKGWMVSQNQEYISEQNHIEMVKELMVYTRISRSRDLTVILQFMGLVLYAITIAWGGGQHDFIHTARDQRGKLPLGLSCYTVQKEKADLHLRPNTFLF